jgi:UDP-N-acetylmuramoylalanine--D-glutamate ligase
MDDLKGKRVVVAGLGKFGGQIAATKWLVAQGASVLVTDRTPADKLKSSMNELAGLPVEFRLGEHRVGDFSSADLIVTTPAIPPHNEFLAAARQAGVPITTEIRLFIERCPANRIVGVTGTKGKSTTTALLGRMLATRYTTHVGGNIGRPLLLELPNIQPDDVVLLELSSFMLEYLRDLQWSPNVAVVTMLSADHLDWHGSPEAYLDAKRLIVKHQKPGDVAVLPEGSPYSGEMAAMTRGRVVFYPTHKHRFELTIPGAHNQFNCQAAWAAAEALGVNFHDAQDAVRDFSGLPHRLELVHESAGVRWFNDSIATIPDAAVAALEAFPPRTVIQIVGGSDKGIPFTALAAALRTRAKAALCIGDTGEQISKLVAESPVEGQTPTYHCHELRIACHTARSIAVPGDVVLLSTGCASYDQFDNFQDRGEQFARFAKLEHG